MAARATNVVKLPTTNLPVSVLTQPCEDAQKVFRKLFDHEVKVRKEREEKARAALAQAYAFGDIAFANSKDFDTLKDSLGVESRAKTSEYNDVVKATFGVWDPEQKDGKIIYKWNHVSDSQVHKYSKIMDYARFKKIAVEDFEDWLNKEGEETRSITKRYDEAKKDDAYEKDRVKRGLPPKTPPIKAIMLTDEQMAMISPRLVDQRDLEEAPASDEVQVVLRQVHASGMVEYYTLPADPDEAQRFLNSILKIDDGEKPFKRLFQLLKLSSLIRTAKDEKGPVIHLDIGKTTTAKIAHNGLRGSVRVDAEFDSPDEDISALDTYLDNDAINYINELWNNFKGEWVFDPPHHIIVTPPSGMTVSARITQINDARKKAAKDAGKDKWPTFSLPDQFKTKGDKKIVVPLAGWIKEDDVRLSEPKENTTYLPQQIVLDKDLVKKIIDKEKEFRALKVPSTKEDAKAGDTEPRVKGTMYNFRITNSRLAFCDVDGDKLGTVDIPKLEGETICRNVFLYKGDLSKVLKAVQSIFKDMPIVWEIADTLFRFSVDGGTGRVSVVLPAAATAKNYNSTAFHFE